MAWLNAWYWWISAKVYGPLNNHEFNVEVPIWHPGRLAGPADQPGPIARPKCPIQPIIDPFVHLCRGHSKDLHWNLVWSTTLWGAQLSLVQTWAQDVVLMFFSFPYLFAFRTLYLDGLDYFISLELLVCIRLCLDLIIIERHINFSNKTTGTSGWLFFSFLFLKWILFSSNHS